jgi:hypothetical protein
MRRRTFTGLLIVVVLAAAGAGYLVWRTSQPEVGGSFYFSISINYSGPWNLAIWGENATGGQNLNFTRSLNGSGDYEGNKTGFAESHIDPKRKWRSQQHYCFQRIGKNLPNLGRVTHEGADSVRGGFEPIMGPGPVRFQPQPSRAKS